LNLNQFGRFQSIFGRLILSYSVVVVIVTVILGFVSYIFFSSRYNREIEKVHQKVLEQVSDTLKFQMMLPATQCYKSLSSDYSEMSTDLLHFTEPFTGKKYKIYQTYEYFKQMVAVHAGRINAIHVYYKKQNLVISSSLGICYLDDNRPNTYKYIDWIGLIKDSFDRSIWIEPRRIRFQMTDGRVIFSDNEFFTFIQTFPIVSTGTDFQGLIAIDINEETVSDLIQDTIPSHYHNTFIINGQGRILSHPQKNMLFRLLNHESYIRRIISSPLSYDSFITNVNHKRSLITFTSLPHTDWKIVNIISIDQFYQSTRFIQLLLIVICLLAILIGLVISFIFTRQIYNPLAIIIQKIRLLAGAPGNTLKKNEYGFINEFIDDITVKVQSFQETEPAIKHNFIMGLLYHRFFSEQELAEMTKLLDDTINFPHYYVALFQMDETAIKDLTLEESQAMKHQINLEIQKNDNEQGKCIGIDLPNLGIGVIVGVKEAGAAFIDGFIKRIISYSLSNYNLPVTVTVGTRVVSWPEIHQSFKAATQLQKYHYFYPEATLIDETFLKKEHNHEMLPETLVTDFSEGLRLRNLAQVEQVLTGLITMISEGNYSANQCQQMVLEIAHVFSVYLKDMRYPLSDHDKANLENLWDATGNIQGFKIWITKFAKKVFNWVEIRTGNRNYQIVEKVVRYLSSNLEKDISLDTAAELVNLSPSYFSKIFKEVMGVAFITYLTDLRLEKAQELLLQTDLSIQEIGFKVGYNASAYFIKQYKAKSGYTPYDYRRQFRNRGDDE
jgi:two-component system response regulator YesN